MGEFRKYRPYYACNALRFNGGNYTSASDSYGAREGARTRVPNFRDIAGVEYGWLKNLATYNMTGSYQGIVSNTTISGIPNQSIVNANLVMGNYQIFVNLTPFATSDLLSEYSVDDYEINKKGRVDFTRALFVAEDVNKILYSMSIFNDSQDEYILNESQYWDPEKTYYALIEGEYVPLSEQPIDWNETYNTYYILKLAEDITVSCIKFRNAMAADASAQRDYTNAIRKDTNTSQSSSTGLIVPIYALLCSYFLDEPVTIAPGDSHLLSLSFESSQF